MNAKRLASIARQMGALWLEYADALEEQVPKRARRTQLAQPTSEPSKEALEKMGRSMRRAGVAA